MPRIKNRTFETFNDGDLAIYEVMERKILREKMSGVRYGDKTIGEKRHYDAKVAGARLSKMVAVLQGVDACEDDIVVIGTTQYAIDQIQDKFDAMPPCKYLSLTSAQISYRYEGEIDA